MRETPTISGSAYNASSFNVAELLNAQQGAGWVDHAGLKQAALQNQYLMAKNPIAAIAQLQQEKQLGARIVKVFIADPNENVALDKRVLYSGDEKLTDLTDQELFFDVPLSDLLATHNEMRKTVVDKAQAEKFGRDIFLEAARIRDLKMVVVTVAQF